MYIDIDFNATRNKVLNFHGKGCFQNVNSCKLWLRYYATTNFWTNPAGIVNLQKNARVIGFDGTCF